MNRMFKFMIFLFCSLSAFAQQNSTSVTGSEFVSGEFDLKDHNGKTVSLKSYRGKYLLVFFGFTHCPSACPIGLHTLSEVLKKLGKDSSKVQALFISVDPERDSEEVIRNFVKNFDPHIVGLRGTQDETEKAVANFRAYYQKLPSKGPNYLMDHSTLIYFMDTQGKYIQHFESAQGSDNIVKFMKTAFNE